MNVSKHRERHDLTINSTAQDRALLSRLRAWRATQLNAGVRSLLMVAVSTFWVAAGVSCGPSGFVDRSFLSTPAESTQSAGLPGAGEGAPLDAAAPSPRAETGGPEVGAEVARRTASDAGVEVGLAGSDTPHEDARVSVEVPRGPLDSGVPEVGPADRPGDTTPTVAPPASLVVRSARSEDLTDLTETGTEDWIHWGHRGAGSITRKRDVPARIEWSLVEATSVGHYDDRAPSFTWTDGAPTLTARTRAGVVVGGTVGAGFRLQLAGPVQGPGRLIVHAGVWNARGELRVWIDGEAPSVRQDRELMAGDAGGDRITTVDFGPLRSGQTLILEWTVTALFHRYGNVTLQAAAYSELAAAVPTPCASGCRKSVFAAEAW